MDLTDDREAVAADAGDEFEVVSPVVVAHIGNVPLPRQAQGTDVQPGSGGGGGLHHLSYHGGPLITAVEVVTIFWGAEWQQFPQNLLTFQLNGFFDYILTGPLMDVLAQYSVPGQIIGHGQRTGTATFSDTEPGGAPRRLTDDDIRQALQGWIRAGGVPAPAANTLYFIFLPPGVTVTAGPWGSCTSMCGYHSSIPGGPMYAVEPFIPCGNSCDFIGDGSALDNLTEVCSHELCEAITDPRGGGWWDDNLARQNQPAEIGDICNGIARRLNGYSIQTQWSNAANNCAVTPVVRWSSWDVPAGPGCRATRPSLRTRMDGWKSWHARRTALWRTCARSRVGTSGPGGATRTG